MEMTTQPHRQMLRRMCTLGRIAGWAMIVIGGLGIFGFANTLLVAHAGRGTQDFLSMGFGVVDNLLTGLLVLATVQFIRYVLEEDTEPGWLLRNVHIFLSLVALYLLIWGVLLMGSFWWTAVMRDLANSPDNTSPMGRTLIVVLTAVATFLPVVTKALCFLGMAAILRTVLPVMAESKTLA